MAAKFYITTAIPYVNAAPHIGHALEFVQTDVVRRYHTLLGENVLSLCGADENALKIFQAAQKAEKTPEEFTNEHNQQFLALVQKLNAHFDVWQRGSDAKHHFPSSQKLWELCEKKGDIYKKSYTGLYCIGCEMFYTEEELNENGECFEHPGRKLERVSEENYFFRLSRHQDFLEDLITNDKLAITPEIRKNEALAFIRKDLPDFSISRSRERARGWGIPVPGDPSQIMYVWFDALNIYQTGIGFSWDEKNYNKWWPQDVMVIGKGITRFHAIYWPAILKSAGLELPRKLFVHGYLTVGGQKMSKTVGNVIDPVSIIDKYGIDATRYYLLREIPAYSDGDFSETRFKELYNADLANGLGNLVARVAKLCEKHTVGLSVNSEEYKKNPIKLAYFLENFGYQTHMDRFEFHLALEGVWRYIKQLDIDINADTPWSLPKVKATEKLQDYSIRLVEIAYALQPFLPETAKTIHNQFFSNKIQSQSPLFPRLP